MALDSRSIAALIETNKTRMNSVMIMVPSKLQAKKNVKSNDTKGSLLPHPR